ncbi:MAG: hypothetical protein WCD20_09845 [Rhodomicrobium sp.]
MLNRVYRHREAAPAAVAIQGSIGDLARDCFARSGGDCECTTPL